MQESNICNIVKLLAIEEDDEGEGNYSKGHTILHCQDVSNEDLSLQDFIVLPTDIFHWCAISYSSMIYLPTSSLTDYVRRHSFYW